MGGILDSMHSEIGTYSDWAVSTRFYSLGGPGFGILLFKMSDSYFSGIIWSYSIDAVQTTPWFFMYANGTRYLRPLAFPFWP